MTDLKTCMDLVGLSSEYAPQRLRKSSQKNSCPDFSECMEEDTSNDSLVPNASVITEPLTSHTHAHIEAVNFNLPRKTNPRLLHNFCMGRITELESRNQGTTDLLD